MESEKSSKMIQDIREKQMSMIKSKEAIEFKQWIINGNINENSQLDATTENMIKLVLRIFNDECDSIIDKVKYSNLEAIEKSIKKFFEDLNGLGNVTQVKISTKYFNTKLEELYLLYDYKLKKQEDVEEKRRLRE
jgi:ribonuclease I